MKKEKKKKIVSIDDKRFFSVLVLWILIFSIGLVVKQLQNDTFYSIKIGNLIINNGIDMLDHFSFHNLPYTYPHWLYDVFIYCIYSVGGFRGIYISTIVLNLILLYVLFRFTKTVTNTYAAPFVTTLVATFTMGHGFATARAQMITYILFTLELYFIEMYIKNKDKKFLIGLILISLIICNVHVAVWPFYFILFLPYIAESIVSIIVKKIKKENKFTNFLKNKFELNNDIPLKDLLIVAFLSVFTGLLTPIKSTPYTYLYKTMIGNSQKYIIEHQMATLRQSIFTLIIVAETIIIGFISKIKIRDLLLLLGVSLMSILSVRHASLFVIIMPICLARTYNYFVNFVHIKIDLLFYKLVSKKVFLIIAFVAVIIFTCYGLQKNSRKAYVNEETYPVAAVNYIKENVDVENMRIYNEYNYGSYLLFNDIKVFIDSRADLYTKQFSGLEYDIFDDYMSTGFNYEERFTFYNITHVILYKTSELNTYLKNNDKYKLLYEDEYFVFYERKL